MTAEERRTSNAGGEYMASQMTVLEGMEAVRKRPGMYIGPTDTGGLHNMIREVVDNSVDEALAGYATAIEIVIHTDNSVTITDNGRGIPVDIHPKEGISGLEIAATKLHGGGKFGQGGYKVSSGLHGVGLSVVNALSEWMRAEVRRHDQLWVQEYQAGTPLAPVRAVGPAEGSGTSITFLPDVTIFKEGLNYNFRTLAQRFREMAYLTKSLRFHLLMNAKNARSTFTLKVALFHMCATSTKIRMSCTVSRFMSSVLLRAYWLKLRCNIPILTTATRFIRLPTTSTILMAAHI